MAEEIIMPKHWWITGPAARLLPSDTIHYSSSQEHLTLQQFLNLILCKKYKESELQEPKIIATARTHGLQFQKPQFSAWSTWDRIPHCTQKFLPGTQKPPAGLFCPQTCWHPAHVSLPPSTCPKAPIQCLKASTGAQRLLLYPWTCWVLAHWKASSAVQRSPPHSTQKFIPGELCS
jgi:hypothetical protein